MSLRSPILALAVLLSATGLASAQTGLKDSVVIRNSTSITITYESQFNSGEWLKVVLRPGETMSHFSNILNATDPAPRVTMRFMDLVPFNEMRYTNVGTNVVNNPHNGPVYEFVIRDGRLYLVR
ncbi:MAG: hypothetical protein U0793_01895 [Gemmataceae bacterium]